MEQKLKKFAEFGIVTRGVVYAGSNDGEEFVDCKRLGINKLIAFEPLTDAYARLKQNHPDVIAYKVALGDTNDEMPIEITENDKASSFLSRVPVDDWQKHEVFKDWNMGQWPIVGKEYAQVVRFADFMKDKYSPLDYNLLFMDVQGMELEALKGFDDFIDNFDGICVELSKTPVYVGEASAESVEKWLFNKSFVRVSDIQNHDDVLFVRVNSETA